MKTKLNPIILLGGILCLASMLFSYLAIRILGIVSFPLSWSICARYLNNMLYAVPVIGVLLLVGGLIDSRPYQAIALCLGLAVIVWYLIVYRSPLNGDAMAYVISANALISNYLGNSINTGDIQAAAAVLSPFMHVGLGFILFIAGVVVSGLGMVLNLGFSAGGSRKSGSGSTPKSYSRY